MPNGHRVETNCVRCYATHIEHTVGTPPFQTYRTQPHVGCRHSSTNWQWAASSSDEHGSRTEGEDAESHSRGLEPSSPQYHTMTLLAAVWRLTENLDVCSKAESSLSPTRPPHSLCPQQWCGAATHGCSSWSPQVSGVPDECGAKGAAPVTHRDSAHQAHPAQSTAWLRQNETLSFDRYFERRENILNETTSFLGYLPFY